MRFVTLLSASLLVLAGCAGPSDEEASSGEPPAAPKTPEPLASYQYTGQNCMEIGGIFLVPVANARPWVPSKYRIREIQGRAQLSVAVAQCEALKLDANGTPQPGLQSDVGIAIDDPEGDPAPATFFLFQATNRDALAENMGRVGMKTVPAPKASLLRFGFTQTDVAQAHVPATGSVFDLEGTALRAQTPPGAQLDSTYWYESENGTVRVQFDIAAQSFGPAHVALTTKEGTVLSKVLGSTRAETGGFLATFHLVGTAKRVTS